MTCLLGKCMTQHTCTLVGWSVGCSSRRNKLLSEQLSADLATDCYSQTLSENNILFPNKKRSLPLTVNDNNDFKGTLVAVTSTVAITFVSNIMQGMN